MKIQTLLGASLALALAVGVGLPVVGQAADQVKGAQKLMEFKPLKSVADLEALEPGDMLAMSCPKCKSVTVTYVETGIKHVDATGKLTMKHLCPGCDTTIETKGHGKAAKDVVKHVCQKCGSKDAFCCVMKKGSGATKGMDEKK